MQDSTRSAFFYQFACRQCGFAREMVLDVNHVCSRGNQARSSLHHNAVISIFATAFIDGSGLEDKASYCIVFAARTAKKTRLRAASALTDR